jgi:pimeloyl-ACP methyl ester carboxylesterase
MRCNTVVRVLNRQQGPTVLVGHSFSGMIVTEAGIHPNVSSLVYVAARRLMQAPVASHPSKACLWTRCRLLRNCGLAMADEPGFEYVIIDSARDIDIKRILWSAHHLNPRSASRRAQP